SRGAAEARAQGSRGLQAEPVRASRVLRGRPQGVSRSVPLAPAEGGRRGPRERPFFLGALHLRLRFLECSHAGIRADSPRRQEARRPPSSAPDDGPPPDWERTMAILPPHFKQAAMAGAAASLAAVAGAQTIRFDDQPLGAAPAGWSCGVTGRGAPRWTVEP